LTCIFVLPTYPTHLIFYSVILTILDYESNHHVPHIFFFMSVTLFFLGLNTLLTTMFSCTHRVGNQSSHPYKCYIT
jgi:hypothetical protein